MYFDRWDIVDAHYWFAVHYTTSQDCPLYARSCRISEYYRPGILATGPATDNAREIYNNLVEMYGYGKS